MLNLYSILAASVLVLIPVCISAGRKRKGLVYYADLHWVSMLIALTIFMITVWYFHQTLLAILAPVFLCAVIGIVQGLSYLAISNYRDGASLNESMSGKNS